MGKDDGSADDLPSEGRLPCGDGEEEAGPSRNGHSAAAAEVDRAACSFAVAEGRTGAARDHTGHGRNSAGRIRERSRRTSAFPSGILRAGAAGGLLASAVREDGRPGLDALGLPARRSSPETVWAVA